MQIQVGEHRLDCRLRPAIMGILNVGTDSPVAHSVVPSDAALRRAQELRDAGAAIIDVGAHSTRTGGEVPSPEQEIARLVPVIEALRRDGHLISVDTWTAAVADAAAAAGAQILNDVTAASDPQMPAVAARHGCPLVVMHMRGRPKQHREADQAYDDVAREVHDYLAERVQTLTAAGVPDVWVDPGFEFAKSLQDNLRMLVALPRLAEIGRPVLISASRKGFLAEALGHGRLRSGDAQRMPGVLEATIAVNTVAGLSGAHVVRVHDVAQIEWAMRVVAGIRQAQGQVQSS